MHRFETSSASVPQRARSQDRLKVLDFDDSVVIIVADGAGGTSGGEQAAETVIREVTAAAAPGHDAEAWCQVLRQLDQRIGVGESTCVVVSRSRSGLVGASVGDSTAWLLGPERWADLTGAEIAKPLLGTGEARPVGFQHPPSDGLLLVATDGFSRYVRREALVREVLWVDFPVLAHRLVEMVRLPSGAWWDDVAIVACRPRRTTTARRRFALDAPE